MRATLAALSTAIATLLLIGCGTGGGAEVLPPEAPTGLSATAGDGAVNLSWNVGSEERVSHYNVYRGDSDDDLADKADVPAGTTDHTLSGLANGNTYYFAVDAENETGDRSEKSNVVSASPAADSGGGSGGSTNTCQFDDATASFDDCNFGQ